MTVRRGLFTIIWFALWTVGAFVAITQLWLLPEEPPLAQFLLLGGLSILFAALWILTLWKAFAQLFQRKTVHDDG